MFTGDNGSVPIGLVGGQKIDGKKGTMLEGGSRVPLLVNWPGTTPAGVVKKDLVDFSDLHPTFVELAKAKPAADRKLDGKSFAPQVLGQLGQPRDWAYVQLGDDRFVRSDRWKLTGSGDLFDMKEAPYRQISVAADTTATDALAARSKLQTALDQLKAENANQDALVKKRSGKKKDKKNKDPAPATP